MANNSAQDILIGSIGWRHDNWNGSFYPDDLPEDWRLPYYANEFQTVLIPDTDWINLKKDEIEQWLEDTDDDFLFYFQLDINTLATSQQTTSDENKAVASLLQIFENNQNRIGGLLLSGTVSHAVSWVKDFRRHNLLTLPIAIDFHHSNTLSNQQSEMLKNHNLTPCWHSGQQCAHLLGKPSLGIIETSAPLTSKQLKNYFEDFRSNLTTKQAALFLNNSLPDINNLRDLRMIKELIIG